MLQIEYEREWTGNVSKTSESIMANELKQIKPFAKIILYSHRLAWLLED